MAPVWVHVRHSLHSSGMLPSGNQHGILDRVEHDLAVDTLFLAQYLDGLKDRFQSVPRFVFRLAVMDREGLLPLELQVCFCNLVQPELDGFPGGFQCNEPIHVAGQRAFPVALIVHRLM